MSDFVPADMTLVAQIRKDLMGGVIPIEYDRDPYTIAETALRGRMKKRVRTSHPNAVHPRGNGEWIMATDPALYNVKLDLLIAYRDLHKQTVVLPSGICLAPAVVGDGSQLLTISGVPMNHVLQPPLNNEEVRKQLGLQSAFANKRHAIIFDALCDIAFRIVRPHSIHINKLASSGLPIGVRDVVLKAGYVLKIADRIDHFLELVRRRDFLNLWKHYDVVFAHVHGERHQPDKVIIEWHGDKIIAYHPQERKSTQVREDGAVKLIIADKSIPKILNVYFPAVAERVRVVWGTGAAMNLVHTSFYTQLLHGFINYMPWALHHTGYADFGRKIGESGHLIGLDMSQFDSTVSYDMSKRFFDNLSKYYDNDWVDTMRWMHHAPFWSPSPERDVVDPKWFGNPWNPLHTAMNYGLPSGVAHNTFMGKLIGFWHTLCCFDDIKRIDDNHPTLIHAIVDIGKGKHRLLKYMGSGDDTVAGSPDPAYANDFRSYVESGGPKLFDLTTEKIIQFLGMVPYKFHEDEKETHVCGNIISQDVKWWCAERGLDDRTYRQFAVSIGWDARNKLYSQCPAYGQMKEVRDESFVKNFGMTPDEMIKREIARKNYKPISGTFTETELLFIDKPARMHYSLDINDVRDELKDEAMTNLPMETGMRLVGMMAKDRQRIVVNDEGRIVTLSEWLRTHDTVVKKSAWKRSLIEVITKMAYTKELAAKLRSNKENKDLQGEGARLDRNLHNVKRSENDESGDYIGLAISDAPLIFQGRGRIKQKTSRRTGKWNS
jgi:hypothetical protein